MTELSVNRNQRIIAEFRKQGGNVSLEDFGTRLILVHHWGAKSCKEYVTPLVALRQDADTWLVAASAGGASKHPNWYTNLLANPDTVIETPEGLVAVRAKNLEGDARDAAWGRFTSVSFNVEYENFITYQERTSRTIPVVALRRAPAVEAGTLNSADSSSLESSD